ncbi:MAG: hypothetical protein ACJ76F_13540 [Bacteroidia bacterium]
MTKDHLKKYLFLIQGAYTLLTGLWALLDISSFMAVTGPKTDLWLVKTVSVLFLCIGLSFLAAHLKPGNSPVGTLLSVSTALAVSGIDLYYSLRGIIAAVYIVDSAVQLVFLIWWIMILFAKK